MSEYLLRSGVSNLLVSLALAALAWAVHAHGKRPVLAHLLWLLVLIKLVTPPLFHLAVIPVPVSEAAVAIDAASLDGFDTPAMPTPFGLLSASASEVPWILQFKSALLLLWALGSLAVLAVSLTRIFRFHHWLLRASRPAQPEVQSLATEIAGRLGLRSVPTVSVCSAQLSPLVWWLGGRVRVLLPASLTEHLEADELRWILAHELGHVRRRDHFVRWLEWLACVAFWWNPVMWWARRNLRINEEICCDALVLSRLRPQPRAYANALMKVVEFLAAPAIRPPALASAITSGGVLEKRFKMIVSKNGTPKTPRWQVVGALAFALGVMPLGVAYAQDFGAVERRLGEGVAKGELSLEQASAMMEALHMSTQEPKVAESLRLDELGGRRSAATVEEWAKAAAGRDPSEDAREQLEDYLRALDVQQVHEADHQLLHRRYEAVAVELREAVESRRISLEDAGKKMGELKLALWPAEDAATAAGDRLKLAAALEDLNKNLNSAQGGGSVTIVGDFRARNNWGQALNEDPIHSRKAEDFARALDEMREALAKREADQEGRMKHYAEGEARIKQAVVEGELSLAEGLRQLEVLKNQLWPKAERQDD